MLDSAALFVFLGTTLVILLTPGPAVLYIVARTLDQGRRAGIVSVLGIALGMTTDSLYALAAGRASSWLRGNESFARRSNYVAGTVYLGLGVAAAATGGRHS